MRNNKIKTQVRRPNGKPNNFGSTSLSPYQTQTYLTESPDVILGGDPLVYRNYTLQKPLVKLAPAVETQIKEPTLIIPSTQPTEIKTPVAELTSGATLKPSTSTLIAKEPQDYVPTIDPIVTDRTYTLKPISSTAPTLRLPGESLTDFAARVRQQAAATGTGNKQLWILLLILAAVVAGFIYLKKKGKI